MSIKIATPISHLFKDEAAGKRIALESDCLECREWCIESELPRQELIHYDVNINMPWNDSEKAELLKAFQKAELKLVTFQMASDYTKPVIVDSMYQAGGEKLSPEQMFRNVCENASWLKSVLRDEIQVGIENNNYYPTGAYDTVTDPSFIRQCIIENNLSLLLDIAHAMVSAHNKKRTYKDYISGLPLERLIQLHICGPRIRSDGMAMDAHELPDEEMDRNVFDVASRYPVRYLTVEYYKDTENLIDCLRRYAQIRDTLLKGPQYEIH